MDASTAASSRLIGAIFVEKGLVTQDQLEQALKLQEDTGERLGEVLVGEFGVSRLELASVLAEQWAEFERRGTTEDEPAAVEPVGVDDRSPVEPPLRRPIGEIFLERGFVSAEALEHALEVQRQTGQRVGEVLVSEGNLTRLDLASALAEQWSAFQKLRPPAPVEPQPWQNGIPAAAPAPREPELQREPRRDLAELEERVRAVEEIAAGSPRAGDLEALSAQLQAAIALVEQRIADSGHADPAPPAAIVEALDDLRARLAEPVRRVEAVEQRLGEIVPSERFEKAVGLRLADLGARLDHVATTVVHTEELAEVRSRLEELAALGSAEAPAGEQAELGELRDRLEEIASRLGPLESLASLRAELDALAARASADPAVVATLEQRIDSLTTMIESLPAVDPELAEKLDALAQRAEAAEGALGGLAGRLDGLDALSERIDELAAVVPAADAVDELRREVGELAAHAAERTPDRDRNAQLAELRERLDEVASRVEDVAARAAATDRSGLDEAVASLRADLAALAGRLPAGVEVLGERIEAIEGRVAEEDAGLRTLAEAVEEQRARLEASVAGERASLEQALAERLTELAGRPVIDAELRARVDELTGRVEQEATGSAELLGELREAVAALERKTDEQRADGRLDDLEQAVEGLRGVEDRVLASLRDHTVEPDVVEELRALIEAMAERAADVGELAALRSRLEELAERPPVDEELRGRVEELAGLLQEATGSAELLGELREAVAALERKTDEQRADRRLDDLEQAVEGLRGVEDRVLASLRDHTVEPDVVEELRALIEAMAERAADVGELAALRSRLEELAERPPVDEELRGRVEELAGLLQEATGSADVIWELREAVAALESRRGTDVHAMGVRLAALESAIESLGGVEERVVGILRERAAEPELVDGLRVRVEELAERLRGSIDVATVDERLARLEARLAESAAGERAALEQMLAARLEELEGRVPGVEEMAAVCSRLDDLAERPFVDEDARRRVDELARRVDEAEGGTGALDETIAVLRTDIESLADRVVRQEERPDVPDPGPRLDDLALRLDEHARQAAGRLGRLGSELGDRLRGTEERIADLPDREEVRGSIAEHAAALSEELEAIRKAAAARDAGLEERLASFAERGSVEELREQAAGIEGRLASFAERGSVEELREQAARIEGRLAGFADRASVEDLRGRAEDLQHGLREARDDLAAARVEAGEQLGQLDRALRAEIVSREASAAERSAAEHAELTALRTRVEELVQAIAERDQRQVEVEAGVDARLREQAVWSKEEAAAVRALVREGEQRLHDEVGSLGMRLDEVLDLRRRDIESAGARADALARKLDEADERRSADLEASAALAADLAARLDDVAVRAAASAAERERGLRADVDRLASVLEEKEAAAIDEREVLRAELERVASSTGWRLERIEQALAADDGEELREAVAELAQRLEAQQHLGEEQARQTERALRKGLATLGSRLAETQTAYLDAGNALRRSIERLGAAVVEADERIVERDDTARFETASSYVAFAPREDGYRMIEVEGAVPAVGGIVEVPGCDWSLVVTRVSASPLPLDARPCAYLERA